jgi:hypothetical protein
MRKRLLCSTSLSELELHRSQNQTQHHNLERATRTMEQSTNRTPRITEPAEASLESALAAVSLQQQTADTESHVEALDHQTSTTLADNEAEGGAVAGGKLNGTAAKKNPEGTFTSQ